MTLYGTVPPHEVTSIVLAIGMFLLAATTFFIGRFASKREEGKDDGRILSKLDCIESGLDDIKRKQEQQEANHVEMMTRLASVEASAKQAHHRLDRHDKQLGDIQK